MNELPKTTQFSEIISDLEEAIKAPPTAVVLPNAVQRFVDDIEKNFETTAESLDITANLLCVAAKELMERAENLRSAHPEVRQNVETWIEYERESNARGKFLHTLFNK